MCTSPTLRRIPCRESSQGKQSCSRPQFVAELASSRAILRGARCLRVRAARLSCPLLLLVFFTPLLMLLRFCQSSVPVRGIFPPVSRRFAGVEPIGPRLTLPRYEFFLTVEASTS